MSAQTTRQSIGQQIAEFARRINREHGIAIQKIQVNWAWKGRKETFNRVDEHVDALFDASKRPQEIAGIQFECDTTDWTAEPVAEQ